LFADWSTDSNPTIFTPGQRFTSRAVFNVRSKLGKAIESVRTSVGKEDKIDVDSSLFHWGRNHVDFAADLNIEDRRNLAGCSGQIQSER